MEAARFSPQLERASLYFHYASGFSHPNTRIYVRLLGPCFKTGQRQPFHQHHEHRSTPTHASTALRATHNFVVRSTDTAGRRRRSARPQSEPWYSRKSITETTFYGCPLSSSRYSPTARIDADPRHTSVSADRPHKRIRAAPCGSRPKSHAASQHPNLRSAPTGGLRFPLNNFKYFLTLFSKFFSSFPHGTCSLSVSRQYLALDDTYHPFRAAIPNNSTR